MTSALSSSQKSGGSVARNPFRGSAATQVLVVVASLALISTSCENQLHTDARPSEAQALELAFANAADAWNVPAPLLKAVGYSATRWYHPPTGSTAGLHGIMQLSDEAVAAASKLTGLPEDLILSDPQANIQAAAALLSDLAEEMITPRDRSDRKALESWWPVLLVWSGAITDDVAHDYGYGIMEMMAEGVTRRFMDGSTLRLSPQRFPHPEGLGTLRRAQGSTDYPGANWVPADSSNHSSGRNATVDRIVLTTAGGSATSAINTFQNSSANVSVHYLIHWNGHITQLVREENAAWHSSCYNHRSIGIMFEGFMSQPDNYTDEMYQAGAELVRWITDERGLARTSTTIIGHKDVNCGDGVQRSAPGEHFDWDRFIGAVNGSILIGEVFHGDSFWVDIGRDDNRIENAFVWLDTGQTTLSTGSLGRFEFLVPPGTYEVTAEFDGYEPGSRTCTVGADQVTWCSVMLTEIEDPDPDPDQGTLAGIVVWGEEGDNPYDIIANYQDTRFVSGATVTIEPGPIVVTTDEAGFYRANVDPGTYTVHADADGYEGRQAPLGPATVAADQTVYRSVMIMTPPPEAPEITIFSPNPGQIFETSPIMVSGRVDHHASIVSTTVNGVNVSLSNNRFQTNVSLTSGFNTIMVSATDRNGTTGYASVNVIYEVGEPDATGVDGFVWDGEGGMNRPVAGATIRVGQSSTTSAEDGWFSLDLNPGTYALRIWADGYIDHVDSVVIPQSGRAELLVPLTPEGEDLGPKVNILSPTDESTVNEPQITVSGNIMPSEPGTSVTINDQPASYSGGNFTGTAFLSLGTNAIVVRATDTRGRTGSAAITVVYEVDDPEPPVSGVDGFVFDASRGPSFPIGGAVVVIGEEQTNTASDGSFSMELLAGAHTVTITAQGFDTHSSTLMVPSEHRATLEIGMSPEGAPGHDDVLEITFPTDGEVLTSAVVMVTGEIHHDDVAMVFINGTSATLEGTGTFYLELNLEPGTNEIEAIALDESGSELGRTSITVQYASAGTGGCSCSASSGSASQSALALLMLLTLGSISSRSRRPKMTG